MSAAVAIEPSVCDFKGNNVRAMKRDGKVWFVAKDVGDVLELSKQSVSDAVGVLPKEFKSYARIGSTDAAWSGSTGPSNLNRRKHLIITYEGATLMIMRSRKPQAVEFQLWLATEVVPSIMEKGYYVAKKETRLSRLEVLAELTANMVEHEKTLREHDEGLADHEGRIYYMEDRAERNDRHLKLVEMSDELPPEKTTRMKVKELVISYAVAKDIEVRDVWNKVYREFDILYEKRIKVCARNRSMSVIAYVESIGMIEDLFKVASSVCAA